MADKKISALTSASTPLAGTEVLPIVQSGSTVKVAVSSLTAGREVTASKFTTAGTAATPAQFLLAGGTTTAFNYGRIANTGGDLWVGLEGSTGGDLFGGTSPYDSVFGTVNATNLHLAGGAAGVKLEHSTANVIVKTGNLVIGTTAKGITTGSAIPLGLGTNNSVTAVTIDTSGNVGVGAAPNATSGRNITVNSIESSIALVTSGAKSYSIASGGNFQYTGSALSFIDNTAAATRMLITTNGELWVANLGDQGAYNLQVGGTGVWGAGAYVNGSDSRLKEEVAPIEPCLDIVNTLNPVTFRYKEDYSKDQSVQPGFIAQELLTALKGQNYVGGVVHEGAEYYNVAYQSLIPVLVKAVQELSARVTQLEAK